MNDIQYSDTDISSEPTEQEGFSLGTILFGLILLLIGALWLLDVGDVLDVTWTVVGSGILVLLGIILIVGARSGSHDGMVFLGVVLSAVVLIGSLANWPSFPSGIGPQSANPTTIAEVESSYEWGIGPQEIDLREVDFPEGVTEIEFSLGTGAIDIHVPSDVGLRVDWRVGLGNADILNQERSGAGIDGIYESDDFESATSRLVLNIQLGVGSVEVRQ